MGRPGEQNFCWDKKWEEESIQPQTHPQGSWLPETGLQQLALRPTLSGRAEVRGSGRVQPGAWAAVGVGPLKYWIARNKQTSFCSQPWPPPYEIQDVCVSSLLLCLNIVCGMTYEGDILGHGSWEAWVLSPQPSLFLTGPSSPSLLPRQSLARTHLQPPLGPQEGSGTGGFQMLHSSCRLESPLRGPHSFPQVEPRSRGQIPPGNPPGPPPFTLTLGIFEALC